MNKSVYIFIDDERDNMYAEIMENFIDLFPLWVHCYTFTAAIEDIRYYSERNYNIVIDFDHDLGEEKGGYDIAKYLIENDIKLSYFLVHSQNPVGASNIIQLLTHYGYIYKNCIK